MVAKTSELDQVLNELKSSPLFNLSLSSKELFHSNFLAWIGELYPVEVGKLFEAFLPHLPTSSESIKVYRERHNIDLTLEYSHGDTLIIENKVKSLPYLNQLEGYAAAIPDKSSTAFLLLSLTEPYFLDKLSRTIQLRDGTIWAFLSYEELAEKLNSIQSQIAAKNQYHGQILHDYILFIRGLNKIQLLFELKSDDNDADFFGYYQEIERLSHVRLHDFVHKLRYAQLAQGVARRLEQENFDVLIGSGSWQAGKAGQITVSSDMSRGTGFFDLKYILTEPNSPIGLSMIGIQLQGNAFRLVFENNHNAAKMAKALFSIDSTEKLWFDLSLIEDVTLEYPKKRDFNQYSGTFFYRSKSLGAQSPQQLINLIVQYSRLMRKNASQIINEITKVG